MKNRKEAAGPEGTAGGSPDEWTARVGRDCRRRGGPLCGSADRAGCSAANPARRAGSGPRRRPRGRRILARLDRGRCPGIASGSGTMVSREDGRRGAQRSAGAAPGPARGRLSAFQPDGRMRCGHGRANRSSVRVTGDPRATRDPTATGRKGRRAESNAHGGACLHHALPPRFGHLPGRRQTAQPARLFLRRAPAPCDLRRMRSTCASSRHRSTARRCAAPAATRMRPSPARRAHTSPLAGYVQ